MDTDTAPTSPVMPRSTPFESARAEPPSGLAAGLPAAIPTSAGERGDRNSVFGQLVKDDGDIAGLVAYSIYKQNKLDWLRAFEQAKGRAPDETELASYIIGEGTPRRLATYRHLAEATLAGNGPEIDGAPASPARAIPAARRFGGRSGEGLTTGIIALYVLIAVLFVVGFYLAMHYSGPRR